MRVQAVNSLTQTYAPMDVVMSGSTAITPVRQVTGDVAEHASADVMAQSRFVTGDGLSDFRRITAASTLSQNAFGLTDYKRRFFA